MVISFLGGTLAIVPVGANDLDRDKVGLCDVNQRLIKYADFIPPVNQKETIFHELIHACDDVVSTNEEGLSEAQVMRLSAMLFTVLRDNPGLVEMLFTDRSGE